MRKIQTHCTSCGVLKTEENTYTNGLLKSGLPKLMSKCKSCYISERVAYQKENKEERNARARSKYVSKRKTPKRAKWALSLASGIRKRCNRPKSSERVIEYDKDITSLYLMELFDKQGGKCYYTGMPMNFPNVRLTKPSVDRIDSTKGYTKDNIVLCCMGINFLKNNESIEDFQKFMSLLAPHMQY